MIKLIKKVDHADSIDATLSLPIDQRVRSRIKVRLEDGREAGIFIQRGSMLRDGDLLISEDNLVVKILAASEEVSTIRCRNSLMLAKAAYHLGNRHIPLQIEAEFLRYQHDAVLDKMLRMMDYCVTVEQAAFEPEAGAYSQQSHHQHTN